MGLAEEESPARVNGCQCPCFCCRRSETHRVAIAGVMACGRRVVLDEPTAGWIPVAGKRSGGSQAYRRRTGLAILLVSHSMERCGTRTTHSRFSNERRKECSAATVQWLRHRAGDQLAVPNHPCLARSGQGHPMTEDIFTVEQAKNSCA